ncbi:predicted protein [Lichtheimia corymbifera JMRC:FSU:9682]|uniref:Uncharacterized protein n=1 Tax=Lichtheimia corymbifera JMRC:FSU:9682 TaxID=1263082 RepID=A0A068SBL9_9FUNG|nr:predicted protein [Lichtheimia corymbifera JMRC:FSU:9682]
MTTVHKLDNVAIINSHRKRMVKWMNEARTHSIILHVLSHLWGRSEYHQHFSCDIENYVRDDEGNPAAPVSMRLDYLQHCWGLL